MIVRRLIADTPDVSVLYVPGAAFALVAVMMTVGWLRARSASGTDPASALRYE